MQRFLAFLIAVVMTAAHMASTTALERDRRVLKKTDGQKEDPNDIIGPPEGPSARGEMPANVEQVSDENENEDKMDCGCPKETSFEEFVDTAETLLHVQIETVEKASRKGTGSFYFADVLTAYKGEADTTIRVNVDTSCGDLSFTKGVQYLICPEKINEGKFSLNPCSRSTPWESLPKVEKQLLSRASTVIKTPSDDPLPANIRVVDDRTVMESYQSCSQLNKDLTQALRFYASNLIIGRDFCKYKPDGQLFTPFAATRAERQDGSNSGASKEAFETNKQFAANEEADIVKDDETHVYLAYGDTLVVWDKRHGNVTKRLEMPAPEDEVREQCEQLGVEATDADEGTQFCFPTQSRASIEGIILGGNRLALIVSGYTVHFSRYEGKPGVLSDYGTSTVRIYDTSKISNGDLPLLAKKELQGQYKEGRTIGSMAHIATTVRVNIESYLDEELRGLSSDDAAAKAKEVIPGIVRNIVRELNSGNQCQSVAKLSAFMWGDFDANTELSDEARCNLQEAITFQTMVKVTSFDMLEKLEAKGKKKKAAQISTGSSVAFFAKDGPSIVTASNDRMIFTANGYRWNATDLSTRSFTYILTFLLPSGDENFEAVPSTFAFVDGYPVTQFAIDEHRGNLRIGTTKGEEYYCEETVTKESGETLCAEWERFAPESQVIILKYSPDGGSMKEIGRVEDLGEGEELRAVVFDGDKAFASTFGINEPLYTLDLSDPKDPIKAGTLDVSGFSTYLHLIEDGRYVIGVGEVSNRFGIPLGLAVSLFDVSDLEKPRLAAEYDFEHDDESFVWSDALFDPKSFRYLPKQRRLILPLKVKASESDAMVDGFVLLEVDLDEEKITFEFTVDHAKVVRPDNCFSHTYVPSRSIVSLGRLITMKGHEVVSTGMNSQKERYRIILDKNGEGCNT